MELHLEHRIAAPAESVWRVLGTDFAHIDRWSSFVRSSRVLDRSEVPPDIQVAATAPVPGRETVTKATLREVLIAYSDEERSLTFAGLGLPRIVRQALDTQHVKDLGDGTSLVSFEVRMDLVGPFALLSPLLRRRMARTFSGVLEDLQLHVEAQTSDTH